MTERKIALPLASLALCLALSACGGGSTGGGGVASTPTTPTTPSTPPPTGANANLLGPLASETFANSAAVGAISVPLSGAAISSSAGPVTLSIVYNATTGTYSLNDGSRSVSFGAANRDAAQSNGAATAYTVTSGSTSDSVILTVPGTGAGQTRYVGAGLWLREVDGTNTIDGRATAFTYGAQTTAASLPRTGAASFNVGLLGIRTLSTNLYSIGGTGTLNVDFASGGMAGSGFYDEINADTGFRQTGWGWRAYGLLSSSANSFGGTMSLDSVGTGTLNGAFYGPAADEVGGVWYARNGSDIVSSGALWGARGTTPVNQATSLGSPETAQFFTPLSAGISATVASGTGNLSAIAASAGIASVYRPQYASVHVLYGRDGRITTPQTGGIDTSYELYSGNLLYTRGLIQVDRRLGTPTTVFDALAYGFETAGSAVPRTGSGTFVLDARGKVAFADSPMRNFEGAGALTANFGSGTISTLGNWTIREANAATLIDSGSWTGSGTISSSANAMTSTINFDGTTDYTGTLTGKFFGPAAQEVGGSLSATSAAGSRLAAFFTGARSGAIDASQTGLASLTGTNVLKGNAGFFNYTPGLSPPSSYNTDGDVEVTFNASTGSYAFASKTTGVNFGVEALNKSFVAGDKVTAESNATYTVYRNASGEARLLNPGASNPLIALTYSSFAAITAPTDLAGHATTTTWYVPFGGVTPSFQMPRAGSASYTGIVVGSGYDGTTFHQADLSGTSRLAVNFGTGAGTIDLALTSTDRTSGLARSLGTIPFSGSIGGACPGGCGLPSFLMTTSGGNTANGAMNGLFFGPTAAEFGSSFSLTIDASGSQTSTYAGVALGRKDP